MTFKFAHNNINVCDLDASIAFYKKALGLNEVRRKSAADGSFTLAFLSDGSSEHQLELTWLRDHTDPYNLGENEIHIAFRTDDFEAAHALHSEMGCICYENKGMGIYFISDPDGYWLEILPPDRH
ncbi:MAG: lactoylglutathione lyase [Oscillospiraceae bacterium]|jgi:lactoylglutathione lyase|nr:lactoylglutathione lyase [Oscillospiraceae bacterium]